MALVPFPGTHSGALKLPPEDDEESDGGKMSFLEHLDELRKRIINACIGIAVGVGLSFFFIQSIYDFLTAPALATLPPGSKLIYTQPTEAFSLYIQISLISGVAIAAPFIMYQVWKFIAPGLYANEKRFVIPFVLFTTLGFLAGGAFNHYVAYPFIMVYFASFNTPNLTYMPQLSYVFGLYVKMLLGLGVIFQMPAVVFFLAKMQILTAWYLVKHFKIAILLVFIIAAVVTPTGDPMTLMIFAAPMLALYVLSIGVAWIVGPTPVTSD
ncbi:MAG: twin-arginine translocase subunit TatC [Luteitalea sp.]|nr:twin-arginine translocase subunit TatC [Luteitalea sp.]